MSEIQTALDRRDLAKWYRPVRDLLLHLVNEEGIRYRFIADDHLALYPPDRKSRPFKVAPKRPAEETIACIEKQFMKVYGVKGPDGKVPYTQEEEPEVTTVEAVPEKGIWGPDGDPANAVRTLAAALGVSLAEGSVSEEDYLAVVAEKDACAARVESLEVALADAGEAERQWRETVENITRQRDELLGHLNRITGIIKEATS